MIRVASLAGLHLVFVVLATLVACSSPPAAAPATAPPATPAPATPTAASPAASSSPSASTAVAPAKAPSSDEVFARLRTDLTACYEAGKKEVPTMTAGKVTLHASVDKGGKTTCAVPSDDSGLTQDVEDCMRKRLGRETYPPLSSAWSPVLPLVVDNGVLGLGKLPNKPLIETIESHGLAEDIYDVVERMLPDLKGCLSGMEKSTELRVIYVGAEVGKDGKVTCALASSPSAISESVRECTSTTLARASFKPPKRGYGLISIPLEVLGRK